MKLPSLAFAFASLTAACGGSDLDPGSGDDPGSGTNTLTVNGDITAEPQLTNAREPGDFTTEFSVRVLRGIDPVTTGTVTVTSASGSFPLTYRSDEMRWEGTAPAYDEVYVLDVEDGIDNVLGVRVDGPDLHFFTAPMPGATVDSTQPLMVTWARDEGADSTSIQAEEIERIAIDDLGEYMLAGGALKAESDATKENTIELRRSNRVTPAGAVAGSEFDVRVENRIQVVAAPNPAL